jgi:CHASE1-domain containing sensor protein
MKGWITGFLARVRADATAWVVLAVGIAASVAVWAYVSRALEIQQRARFESAAVSVSDAIHDRTDAYLATLRATRAFFESGREPTRSEFGAFVRGLDLDRFYPGILGIGFAKMIPAADLERYERAVRAEGFPEYRVWPPGPRDPYSAILYIEPFDQRNRRAVGYDMFSEPVRREAMTRARDTGIAAASARVELVQESGAERQPGFVIYLAVYEPGPGRARSHVRGFVYAPFRAGDLLAATLVGTQGAPIQVEVFDGDHVGPGDRLYSSARPRPSPVRASWSPA